MPAAAQTRPVARVLTITSGAPHIDGRLDEAVWQRAPVQGDFVERKPSLRSKPPVRTTFRVLQDAQALYFGIYCYDDQPDKIRGLTLTRDDFALFRDDAVSLKIDPRLDGRTTIGFALNAAGGRLDYRGVNESDFLVEHDALWRGAAHRTKDGWSAEFRIPLDELGINASDPAPSIGLNLSRDHSRRNATYDWALLPPPFSPIAASRYGRLEGLTALAGGADGGSGGPQFALQPYALSGYRAEREDGRLTHESILNGGGDVMMSWGRLRGQLTVNTDFAQVDLDNQTVNFTRFGLFLPEKRRFFLRDLELLQLGRQRETQMFYSRRIGLDDSAGPVPIAAGIKLVGQPHDDVRLALVQATTQATGDAPWTSHASARGVVELGGGSNVGAMLNHRQSAASSGDRNTAIGLDGSWRGDDDFPVVAQGYAIGTLTGPESRAAQTATGADATGNEADRLAPAAGIALSLRDLLWRPSLRYAYLHPAFRNDLGFTQRVGIHRADAALGVEPRLDGDNLEKVTVTASGQVIADADPSAAASERLLDWRGTLEGQLRFNSGSYLGFATSRRFERVGTSFDVGRNTAIDEGDYHSWIVSVWGGTPGQKLLSGNVTLTARDYYNGTLHEVFTSFSLQPSRLFRFDVSGLYDYVLFPDRPSFESLVINGRLVLGFTSKLGLSLYGGYNLLGDTVQVQSRLRWSYAFGSDLFVVQQLNLNDESGLADYYTLLVKSSFRWDL